MTDAVTLSYINLYAVLGALPKLCELVPEASALVKGKPVSVGFAVKGGPHATLCFQDGGCTLRDGVEGCDILLPFSSPEKFNGLIDGTVTPVPRKGFTRIHFLLKEFTALTNLLTRYLKASADDLKDDEFFTRSTTLMLYVVAAGRVPGGEPRRHRPVQRLVHCRRHDPPVGPRRPRRRDQRQGP